MKGTIRSLPALAAAVFLGMYWASPEYAQATKTARECSVGLVLFAAVMACILLCIVTKSRSQAQTSSGWSGPARKRNGR